MSYLVTVMFELMPSCRIAIGSNYGFALIDGLQNKLIMVHSTFDASKIICCLLHYINPCV